MPSISGMSAAGVTVAGFPASQQQIALFNWVDHGQGNAIMIAVAGAGKTTTVVEACKRIRGTAILTAYNKKIAEDMAFKLTASGVSKNVQAKTLHAIGYGAWRRVATGLRPVEKNKLAMLATEMRLPRNLWNFCTKSVSLAKQRGIGIYCHRADQDAWLELVDHFDLADLLVVDEDSPQPQDPESLLDLGLSWSVKLFDASAEACYQLIDFDDMIFAPLYFNAQFTQVDWLLLDEAQDSNWVRRELVKRLLKPGGRLIAVGDPRQAIYGFTGADNDALDVIAREFNAVQLPLTVTYRCPKAVVKYAQQWVSHIEAADSATEGEVLEVQYQDFLKVTPDRYDAILCRNTKPLVQLAFDLLRRKIACHVEGKEIGEGLIALCRKWKTPRDIGELRVKLSEYLREEGDRLLARGQDQKAEDLKDKVETLYTIMESAHDDQPISVLINSISVLFYDTVSGERVPTVTLSTVHKAKGREWDTVYLLGRERFMPSPYARQDWQVNQEYNLIYVAVTRAKQQLIEVIYPKADPNKRRLA